MKKGAHRTSDGFAERWRRAAVTVLAVAFAVATAGYTFFLLSAQASDLPPTVELGLDFPYHASENAYVVSIVRPGSPAERAGLRPGDRVIALDGKPVTDPLAQVRVWKQHRVGDSVRLTVRRPGQAQAIEMTGVFRRNSQLEVRPTSPQEAAGRIARSMLPLSFALVGLIILLLRPADRNVWLMACFFAGIIAAPGFPNGYQTVPQQLRVWAEAYEAVFLGFLGASFYWLWALFPQRSPLDRSFPWLKWVGLALGMTTVGEVVLPDIVRPFPTYSRVLSPALVGSFGFCVGTLFLALGLVALAANYFVAREPQARRKIRVIFWGTVLGLSPPLIRAVAEQQANFHTPPWLDIAMNITLMLVPSSFAYAVFKQRVLDIPVLLRRSARYVLVQRGFLILLCFASFGLTLLFAGSLARLPALAATGPPVNITLGAVLGTGLLWGGAQVHRRVGGRIDRAFFRAAYDACVILENLAETSRKATNRETLAELLYNQLNAALRPTSLAVYLVAGDGKLAAAAGTAPEDLQTLAPDVPLLVLLCQKGEAWVIRTVEHGSVPDAEILKPLEGGCLVPVMDRRGGLAGLFALGPRLSEEPYSGEDGRLLASVASQAATALENFRLAEDIAARLETERRTMREMEIAKQVQTRLLPQSPPVLRTLACAGRCLQARSVGGDYYDFLELGLSQTGLVLADVSGKGVHAALLMANLQAYLRSIVGVARGADALLTPSELVRALEHVNRTLWKSTSAEHYATLFFGLYDDSTRRLDYVNCGHNPPVLLRASGAFERLAPTASVVGAFERWTCSSAQVQIQPDDLLAVFSDGVTEAMQGEEEFGEDRFLGLLRASVTLPVDDIVRSVFSAVQSFSAGNQSDDLTLLVARGKPLH